MDTWKDGVIQKQGAGTSDYASRSEVAFKDGKKHGEERVLAKDGRLTSIITWSRGVKDGKELEFADDGKRIVKQTLWQAGVMKELTELYLNGNPKLKEIYEGPKRKLMKEFWDTGKVSREGAMVFVRRALLPLLVRGRRAPVLFRKRRAPVGDQLSHGQAPGTEPELVGKRQARDRRRVRRRQDDPGQGVGQRRQAGSDDQFEADGSRKIKR